MIAAALPAVAGLVDERAGDGNPEPANRSLFPWRIEIRPRMGERIEGPAVVDQIDRQPVAAPTEGGGNALRITVRDDIGEELFEDDEESGPFVVGETAIAGECPGKGLEPVEFGALAAQGGRSPHRGLMPSDPRRRRRVSEVSSPGVTVTPVKAGVQGLRCKTLPRLDFCFRGNDRV